MDDGNIGIFLCCTMALVPGALGFWIGYNWRGRVARLGRDAWKPGIIRMIEERRRVHRGQ